MSKKYRANVTRRTIYVEPSTYDTIKLLASKKKQSITETVRILLETGINNELITDNSDSITKILLPILREISHADTERLAKLIIKTMKASAAGMYLASQAIEDIGHNQGSAMLEEALKMAVKYIKVAYDPKDYTEVPLKTAKSEAGAIDMADITNITDEELLNMTI